MLKKLALAMMASSLLFACGGEGGGNNNDDECTLDETAVCTNKQCGNVTAQDSCGASKTISCGTCQDGYTCMNNICISSEPKECVITDEIREKACANKCGTVKILDTCHEMQPVDCGEDCGGSQVCNLNENTCVDVSSCTVDRDSVCGATECGPKYDVTDSCGQKQDTNCGCDAEVFVNSANEAIPASEMHCMWGEWYHISSFSGYYCAESAGGMKYCGEFNFGGDDCGKDLIFTCDESNCPASDSQACVQNLCAPYGECTGARDQVSSALNGSDIQVTAEDGFGYVSSKGVAATYYDVTTNTMTKYVANQVIVAANGNSLNTLVGQDLDLSKGGLAQNKQYDFICGGENCFGVVYTNLTTSSSQWIIYEANAGTLNFSKASATEGVAGTVTDAEMFTWLLSSDTSSCHTPKISFSFDFPADTIASAACETNDSMVESIDGNAIDVEGEGAAIVNADSTALIMNADIDGKALFTFGINALNKLRTFSNLSVYYSYTDLNEDEGYIYCDAEADDEYGEDGICVSFWMYELEGERMMLSNLYEMVSGIVSVSSVTGVLEGSVKNAYFQDQMTLGVCAETTPISFSFSGAISAE